MDIQRIRNLTTGILHTEMKHIYEDIEYITGEKGILTHELPTACRAMESWLKEKINDSRFWEEKFDTTHIGNVEISPMTEHEVKTFWSHYTLKSNV